MKTLFLFLIFASVTLLASTAYAGDKSKKWQDCAWLFERSPAMQNGNCRIHRKGVRNLPNSRKLGYEIKYGSVNWCRIRANCVYPTLSTENCPQSVIDRIGGCYREERKDMYISAKQNSTQRINVCEDRLTSGRCSNTVGEQY